MHNDTATCPPTSLRQIFMIFLKLGCISFGGPVAHLAYFEREFVQQRRWLSEEKFTEIMALCQFLPGPSSSQVGLSLGHLQRGPKGAIAAWLGFTLPSATLMAIIGITFLSHQQWLGDNTLHWLKIITLAVVAQAVWSLANKICKNRTQLNTMFAGACLTLLLPGILGQLLLIIIAALIGALYFSQQTQTTTHSTIPRAGSINYLFIFAFLLIVLPLLTNFTNSECLQRFDSFYSIGSLVFGGGHVVLPMLEVEMMAHNWMDEDTFLAGYALAQAMPGPLFTFSAYLGAVMPGINPWLSSVICLLAIFLPSFLLICGIQPYWQQLRQQARIQGALYLVNPAVVGLLVAAFYTPVWQHAIFSAGDFALAIFIFAMLQIWRLPAWLIVVIGLIFGLSFDAIRS